jgi:hypothetical protein
MIVHVINFFLSHVFVVIGERKVAIVDHFGNFAYKKCPTFQSK